MEERSLVSFVVLGVTQEDIHCDTQEDLVVVTCRAFLYLIATCRIIPSWVVKACRSRVS